MRGGWWTVFRRGGTAFRVHLGLLLLLACALAVRSPGLLVMMGVLSGLMLVHELGHAWVVRRVGGWVDSIDLGLGIGFCRWSGSVSPLERAAIAWGGVGAQGLVLVVAIGLKLMVRAEAWSLLDLALDLATFMNFVFMAMNLVPARILDGYEAWNVVPLLWRRFRRRPARAPVPAAPRAIHHLRVVEHEEGEKPPTIH